MTIAFTSDYPLLIVGTEVIANPSFEDWLSSSAPSGWSATGTVTYDSDHAYPSGSMALKASIGVNNMLQQSVTIADFGLSAFPSWATSWVFGAVIDNTIAGLTNYLYINGGCVATASTLVGKQFVYGELSGGTTLTSIGIKAARSGTASNYTYVDSVMFGFGIDLNVFMTKWNPVAKWKDEQRDSPLNVSTQLLSDAYDLKCEFNRFGPTLKRQLLGMKRYMALGHYCAVILDRNSSCVEQDEWMPYLRDMGQESPEFQEGSPGTFKMSFNGRGCVP